MPEFPFQTPDQLSAGQPPDRDGRVEQLREGSPKQLLGTLEEITHNPTPRERNNYQQLKEVTLQRSRRHANRNQWLWTPLLDRAYQEFGPTWKLSRGQAPDQLMVRLMSVQAWLPRATPEQISRMSQFRYPPLLEIMLGHAPHINDDLLDELIESLWEGGFKRHEQNTDIKHWQDLKRGDAENFLTQIIRNFIHNPRAKLDGLERLLYWVETVPEYPLPLLKRMVSRHNPEPSFQLQVIRACRKAHISGMDMTQQLQELPGAHSDPRLCEEAIRAGAQKWVYGHGLADTTGDEYLSLLEQAIQRWPGKTGRWILEASGLRGHPLDKELIQQYYLSTNTPQLRQLGLRMLPLIQEEASEVERD